MSFLRCQPLLPVTADIQRNLFNVFIIAFCAYCVKFNIHNNNQKSADFYLEETLFLWYSIVQNHEIGLLFYYHLNGKDDEFLEASNFSREEIMMGIQDLAERYNLSGIAEAFRTEIL